MTNTWECKILENRNINLGIGASWRVAANPRNTTWGTVQPGTNRRHDRICQYREWRQEPLIQGQRVALRLAEAPNSAPSSVLLTMRNCMYPS
jgi:hypothetical protein